MICLAAQAVAAAGSCAEDLFGDDGNFVFSFDEALDDEGKAGLLVEFGACGFRDFAPVGVQDDSVRFGTLSIIL